MKKGLKYILLKELTANLRARIFFCWIIKKIIGY